VFSRGLTLEAAGIVVAITVAVVSAALVESPFPATVSQQGSVFCKAWRGKL